MKNNICYMVLCYMLYSLLGYMFSYILLYYKCYNIPYTIYNIIYSMPFVIYNFYNNLYVLHHGQYCIYNH